jgi:hypothetical protein
MSQPNNQEFEAFKAVYDALEPLDDDARSRVTKSVVTLLAIDAHISVEAEDAAEEADMDDAANEVDASQPAPTTFATFAELYAAAAPTTNAEKALLAGYWIQVSQGNDSFTGQAANKELTHLGHKAPNITAAIDKLKGVKPQLVLQVKKSGSSQQARKIYKVSYAGVEKVKEMLGG